MVSVHEIARAIGISVGDVQRILARAPLRYKVYDIPKRSGGSRTIAQPSTELKVIQRYLVDNVFDKLAVSDRAMAYRKGVSIRDNAKAHSLSPYILKLDFTAFFHSFRLADMDFVFKINSLSIDRHEMNILKLASYWRPKGSPHFMFAMGAPSSPMLTNAMMYEIDSKIAQLCAELGAKYTRYADDITISGERADDLIVIERGVREVVQAADHPKLRFNDTKRGLYGPGQKKIVTGLILTPDGKISIGRDRKRQISAGVHWWLAGKIASEMHIEQLRGLVAFANDAEPTFVSSLSQKYGARAVANLMGRQKASFWTPSSLPRVRERFFGNT